MALRTRNVARGWKGDSKGTRVEIKGLKELERKLKALLPENPSMRAEMKQMMLEVGIEVRDVMRSKATSAGWAGQSIKTRKGEVLATGQQAIDSIFASSKGDRSEKPRERIGVLVGVGKRHSMVKWIAGKHPKSPRANVAAGNPVAMAFATMLEFGTSNRGARPAIRGAIESAKGRVISLLTDEFNLLLQKYSA